MSQIIKHALTNALATAAYIVIIAFFFFFAEAGIFGTTETIFIPMAMLMLLVFSVALVGTLMFGTPVMWYIDGKKKEALKLLIHTLGIFLITTSLAFIVLIVFSR